MVVGFNENKDDVCANLYTDWKIDNNHHETVTNWITSMDLL